MSKKSITPKEIIHQNWEDVRKTYPQYYPSIDFFKGYVLAMCMVNEPRLNRVDLGRNELLILINELILEEKI